MPNQIPVTVIGGYLGAGKTTLVNNMLRNADGKRLAVLVNEFGELSIDADLIEAKDENMISIAGGCVCCSYGNDMIAAMMELARMTPAPDHVLLEASGIAIPGAIGGAISILNDFALEGIVVLANAETIHDQASDKYVGDTIERQLSDSDIIVLNKVDLLDQIEVEPLRTWLRATSNESEVVNAVYGQIPNDVILGRHAEPDKKFDQSTPHQTGRFVTQFFAMDHVINARETAEALADVSLNLVRAKGFVKTSTGIQTLQIVGRRWEVNEAPTNASAGLVVIGQKQSADMEKVKKLLDQP